MQTDPFFSLTENQSLLVVCARKKIRNAAILGIAWGIFNFLLGYFAIRFNPLNVGLILLGLLMIATGLVAILIATLEHRRDLKTLKSNYPTVHVSRSLAAAFAALIAILGIVALTAVILRK